ncbi:hypothetical protein V1279_007589 [Bradyrhizobium sp. AZCC 1610]
MAEQLVFEHRGLARQLPGTKAAAAAPAHVTGMAGKEFLADPRGGAADEDFGVGAADTVEFGSTFSSTLS